MIFPAVSSLIVLGIYDRGIRNRERIHLFALDASQLGEHAVLSGVRVGDANQGVYTAAGGFLHWFADELVPASTSILLYTGPGQNRWSTIQGGTGEQPVYVAHAGRPTTVLANHDLAILLVRIAECSLPIEPLAAP